jgi:hypothetical protein
MKKYSLLVFGLILFYAFFPAKPARADVVVEWDRQGDPTVLNYFVYWRPQIKATSTSSLTVSNGPKVFVTQAGLPFVMGSRVIASSNPAPDAPINYMEGAVTDYSDVNLTVNVDWSVAVNDPAGGPGPFATWELAWDWGFALRSDLIPQPADGAVPSYQLSTLALAGGNYEVCVTAIDAAGNESNWSNSAPFYIPASPHNLRAQ